MFMCVEGLWSIRTGFLLLLTASRSKANHKFITSRGRICLNICRATFLVVFPWKSLGAQSHNQSITVYAKFLSFCALQCPEEKQRMLVAGVLFWVSINWKDQSPLSVFSQWRGSTGMSTFVIQPTVSWTMTSHWLKLPRTSKPVTSSAMPACRTSRSTLNQGTTVGWLAGAIHEVKTALYTFDLHVLKLEHFVKAGFWNMMTRLFMKSSAHR